MIRSEKGSGLVLALAMVTIVGLLISAVLGFAGSSVKAADTVRVQGKQIYAADGAIEYAIQQVQYDPNVGANVGPCNRTFAPPQTNTWNVTVECNGLAPPAGGVANQPGSAIQALSTIAGENGLEYVGSGLGSNLRVRGAVRANRAIIATGQHGELRVDGPIRSRGACTPLDRILVTNTTDSRLCSNTSPAFEGPEYLAVDYPSDVDDESAVIAPPSSLPTVCPSNPGWLVEFFPGRYTSAAPLNFITGAGGCNGKPVVWFHPGVYYFEFLPPFDVWTVSKDLNVVAGTPTTVWDADPTAPRPSGQFPFPGACQTPENSLVDGVQFIFAGTSRMEVTNGQMELCPKTWPSRQRITIYQHRSSWPDPFARPAANSCIVTGPWDPSNASTCALIGVTGNNASFISHGTVYAPSATVALEPVNDAYQILGRGIIARKLYFKAPGSFRPVGDVISVPATVASLRRVELVAIVDGRARVRVVVLVNDASIDRTLTVESWSVRR